MAKLPYVTRDDLPEDKRHVYDRIAETRGSVDHIFRLLLNSPDAAEVATSVGGVHPVQVRRSNRPFARSPSSASRGSWTASTSGRSTSP